MGQLLVAVFHSTQQTGQLLMAMFHALLLAWLQLRQLLHVLKLLSAHLLHVRLRARLRPAGRDAPASGARRQVLAWRRRERRRD